MKESHGEPEEWQTDADLELSSFNKLAIKGGNLELATFGAGCFWGTEKYFANNFAKMYKDCIMGTSVGFMNVDPSAKENPSYDEVCEGQTGYIEVVHLLFDKTVAEYSKLVEFFFTFHDPTTKER